MGTGSRRNVARSGLGRATRAGADHRMSAGSRGNVAGSHDSGSGVLGHVGDPTGGAAGRDWVGLLARGARRGLGLHVRVGDTGDLVHLGGGRRVHLGGLASGARRGGLLGLLIGHGHGGDLILGLGGRNLFVHGLGGRDLLEHRLSSWDLVHVLGGGSLVDLLDGDGADGSGGRDLDRSDICVVAGAVGDIGRAVGHGMDLGGMDSLGGPGVLLLLRVLGAWVDIMPVLIRVVVTVVNIDAVVRRVPDVDAVRRGLARGADGLVGQREATGQADVDAERQQAGGIGDSREEGGEGDGVVLHCCGVGVA